MIALIQRVNHASVTIAGETHAAIGKGILALIGIEKNDTRQTADRMLERILAYRIFADAEGKMNLSLRDVGGGLLLVSQFTLAADTRRGLRPGFSSAKHPAEAELLFSHLVDQARASHDDVATGQFGAEMKVALENDGPVTFQLQIEGNAD